MRPRLILFGDSITEESFGDGGWGAALAHLFSRTADVVLRGYSGYNTRWALKVAERAFDGLGSDECEGTAGGAAAAAGDGGGGRQQAPLAVTVFFGANDASLPDRSSAFQHVPLPEYRINLHAILSFLKKRWPSSTLIILITPPPIDEDGRLKHPYGENPSGLPERTNEAAGAYANACVSVAMEAGVPVVDLWFKMQQFPSWEKALLSDGLHLTPDGNRIVFQEVADKLREHGLSPETLPTDLPLLSEIDPLDPLKSFDN
uniref:GDSL esterase/lipase At5g45920 n=1 Tax=Anthurium amnicola TaxID=1678845 RepID=A0A1D1ZIP9_9ARAE